MEERQEARDESPARRVVKKKGGHGGHHGGAWKVAYADFVTAMMALFIVLWITGQSKNVKEAISGYFKDPAGFQTKGSAALLAGGGASPIALKGGDAAKPPEPTPPPAEGQGDKEGNGKSDRERLEAAAEHINQILQALPQFQALKDQVQVQIINDGLRVQLLEGKLGAFFDVGSSRMRKNSEELLRAIAQELAKLPNQVAIEGHTDARPYGSRRDYTNWELSVDRANSARRAIEAAGVRPNQVAQVVGYADQQLQNPQDPLDTANRRISIIVRFLNAPAPAKAEAPAGATPRAELKGNRQVPDKKG